jgi:hypothetical protein
MTVTHGKCLKFGSFGATVMVYVRQQALHLTASSGHVRLRVTRATNPCPLSEVACGCNVNVVIGASSDAVASSKTPYGLYGRAHMPDCGS